MLQYQDSPQLASLEGTLLTMRVAMKNRPQANLCTVIEKTFSKNVFAMLNETVTKEGIEAWISGGTVRDWLLGRRPADLDITVNDNSVALCQRLIQNLGGGTLVKLGTAEEEAARVVYHGKTIDISSFRKNALTIEADLALRDYTMNALAVSLHDCVFNKPPEIIDPLNGMEDLASGKLVMCPDSFADDPLRMARGYRFMVELQLRLDQTTHNMIKGQRKAIHRSAKERVADELNRIMSAQGASAGIRAMAESGLLWELLPELEAGVGISQPGYHHEDVFGHCVLTLEHIDQVILHPERYFAGYRERIIQFLQDQVNKRDLRWAALLHDCGKSFTREVKGGEEPRITFYNHDQVGTDLVVKIGERLRWSRMQQISVATLVEMHMHPFHLCNVSRTEELSRKACLNLFKRANEWVCGLFVLAMADSLAGRGEKKPLNMEDEIASLFERIQKAGDEDVKPVIQGPRLITGHDIRDELKLAPGPIYKQILDDLEVARVEGLVATRNDALEWIKRYVQHLGPNMV